LIKRANIVAVSIWVFFFFARPLPAQWETNVYPLKLSGRADLKAVFDSGLRPKRDNINFRCFVNDKIVRFDIGSDRVATIPAETCRFKIYSSNQALQSLDAETPPLTIEETRRWMIPICRSFGRTEKELNDFLGLVRNGDRGFGWLGREAQGFVAGTPRPEMESGLAGMSVRLQHHAGDRQHPIRIVVAIEWERPRREIDYPQTPLQPPKGYETFSMEPEPFVPSWIRRGEPAPDNVQREYGEAGVQRLREHYAEKMGKTNSSSAIPTLPAATAETDTPVVPNVTSKKSL
jgi:hypothetical protein